MMPVISTNVKAAMLANCVGLLLCLIATSTTSWLHITLDGRTYHIGLFSCAVMTSCDDLMEFPSKLEIFGVVIAACGLAVYVWAVYKDIEALIMYAGVVCMVSGACTLVGTIVFGAQLAATDQAGEISWSFALAIVGGVIVGMGGALAYFRGQSPLGSSYTAI